MNRFMHRVVVLVAATAALLAPAGLANAAAPTKLDLLSSWTQTSVTSYNAWITARNNSGQYASYGFDWSTDYCSSSPDNPLGFDFRLSCAHHDFGYRNYKAVGQFGANKDRVDSMFYADLKRKCATYSSALRPPCYSLAWTYYQAVHLFGSLAAVTPADLEKARALAR